MDQREISVVFRRDRRFLGLRPLEEEKQMPQNLWRLDASGPKLRDKPCSADRRQLELGRALKAWR